MFRTILAVLTVAVLVTNIRAAGAKGENECGPNQVWDECGSSCPPRCPTTNTISRRHLACATVCVTGCRCMAGFMKKSDGSCVKRSACGPIKTKQPMYPRA